MTPAQLQMVLKELELIKKDVAVLRKYFFDDVPDKGDDNEGINFTSYNSLEDPDDTENEPVQPGGITPREDVKSPTDYPDKY